MKQKEQKTTYIHKFGCTASLLPLLELQIIKTIQTDDNNIELSAKIISRSTAAYERLNLDIGSRETAEEWVKALAEISSFIKETYSL